MLHIARCAVHNQYINIGYENAKVPVRIYISQELMDQFTKIILRC